MAAWLFGRTLTKSRALAEDQCSKIALLESDISEPMQELCELQELRAPWEGWTAWEILEPGEEECVVARSDEDETDAAPETFTTAQGIDRRLDGRAFTVWPGRRRSSYKFVDKDSAVLAAVVASNFKG